jgi:hypothetical protein
MFRNFGEQRLPVRDVGKGKGWVMAGFGGDSCLP